MARSRASSLRHLSLRVTLVALCTLFWTCSVATPVAPEAPEKRQEEDYHWVATWTSMPQLVEPANLPPSPFAGPPVLRDATLRQTFHTSIAARMIRIQFSNTFGGSPLPITAASLAIPIGKRAGVGNINPSTLVGLTFNGSASVTIPAGQVVYSDPADFEIDPQSMLTVSMYLRDGQSGSSITGHPGSRTTSWMQQGNRANESSVTGTSTVHWYFASAVEVWVPRTTAALVILGDSITDGRGSDNDQNNRWPDLLLARMQREGITDIAVCNQAAGGNTVLAGGLGPPLLQRYRRDLLGVSGVKYALIFEGVNDIGGGSTDSGTQTRIGNDLIAAYRRIAADAKTAGLTVFGATITPFNGNGQQYSDARRDQTRRTVNQWILAGGEGSFDGTIDFAGTLADPSNPSILASRYDGGDHLHPNVAGFQAVADAFPLTLFSDASNNGTGLPRA